MHCGGEWPTHLSLLKLECPINEAIRLADVATVLEADVLSVPAHDAVLEANQEAVLPVRSGRIVHRDLKASIRGKA